MPTITELSEQYAGALEPYQDRLEELLTAGISTLRVRDALRMYERREVSLGRAVELAGVTREEFIREALVVGVKPTVDADTAAQELA